jgi:3-oxoacyl-[acyl-carrier-protein] synthase II
VLGQYAYEIGVSSIKGAIGHLMGAAGAVEAVATVQAIQHNLAPPTVNYDAPDPDCDLDYIPNQARDMLISCAVNLSSGLGGSNAAVVFRAL